MKFIIALVMVLVALPCYAAIVTPPLPIDGNGNVVPSVWDGSTWVTIGDTFYSPIATVTAFDSSAGGSIDTIDLGAVYNWLYVTADTDAVVSFSYSADAAGGDYLASGGTLVYNIKARYLWVRTRSGLAAAYPVAIRVRGMR